jgi:hypothetical protein
VESSAIAGNFEPLNEYFKIIIFRTLSKIIEVPILVVRTKRFGIDKDVGVKCSRLRACSQMKTPKALLAAENLRDYFLISKAALEYLALASR